MGPDIQSITLQVLTNGIEVKLQRNALSVIEAPTGNEEDDDLDFENTQWNGSDLGESSTLLIHFRPLSPIFFFSTHADFVAI